jgi:thiol-disulfide isomerase/thioredoxin
MKLLLKKLFKKWPLVLLLTVLLGTLAVQTVPVQADAELGEDTLEIFFFWGDGCPHCADEKPFLEELSERYPQVEVKSYEVWYNDENKALFQEMSEQKGFDARYVPTTVIGDQTWTGYNDVIKEEIEAVVVAFVEDNPIEQSQGNTIKLPIIGKVDLSSQSLLVSTLIISFVDGFNPCSLWVLSMLLAITLHTGSRKKVILIGFVFVAVTAAVYALFILGVFSVLSLMSYLTWIQVGISILALVFALINIKDYFWYKEGVSLTISDKNKPGLFQKMRRILDAGDSLWGVIGATVALAAGVSLVEFSCTAGFPVVWSNMLSAQGVDKAEFGLLLLVYMLVYQIDELGIFLAAVFTLKASKVEEQHGRLLKLVGGMLMLSLSAAMLIDPNLMNDLSSSLLVFGGALLLTLFVLLMHRKVLPAFGIWIGSEKPKQKRKRH